MVLPAALLAMVFSAAPPKGVDVARQSNVVWTDPKWKNDGTGAMPIGNGDVTSSVWVEPNTGDLRLLLSKSDVFDENSQPVKTGVLRLSFDPPLFSSAPIGPSHCKNSSAPLALFEKKGGAASTICDQANQISNVDMRPCGAQPQAECAAAAAKACCGTPGCVAFSINPQAHMTEYASTTITNRQGGCANCHTPGPGWSSWTMKGVAPAPAPAPPPTSCTGTFCQTLDVGSSTVTIKTKELEVNVFVELNAPLRDGVPHRDAGIVHVTAASATGTGLSSDFAGFGLKVALEPYRVEGKKTSLGRGFCYPRFEHADTIVSGTKDEISWYHWNHINTTYQNDTMANQGVDPAANPHLAEIFTHRAFGGSVKAAGLTGGGLSLSGKALSKVDVQVNLLTMMVESPSQFTTELAKIESAPPASDATTPGVSSRETSTTWAEIMERSYIEVRGKGPIQAAVAKAITDHVTWDRYLSLIQGRVSFAPIKFNGQAFNCNNTGKGWDARDWGADYWWQNERQPYYNVLAQGDIDTMRSFLDFYLRMLPYVKARTKAQFKGTQNPLTAGALYEETCTQFGMYNEGDWGCHHPVPAPNGASSNTYIRFHWTGALELSLMVLDHFDATGNLTDLKKYLPMATGVVEAYRQRFPNKDSTGKIDMWPAQALETYQCHDPTSRTKCPTNPSTDIGGLRSVLPKLIGLPETSGVTAAQRTAWKAHLAALPALPIGPAAKQGGVNARKILPIAKGDGFPTTGSGQRSNSENTEMYVAHPFRLFGNGKTEFDITLAQQAYAERHSPCNDGWCQDIIQAAMLNMSAAAADQLKGRALASNHGGYRFAGFAGHYQDYEPSLDHYGFMRTGLNYMLLSPLDDAKRGMLIFPTFPTQQWDVRFKLHAPKNTVIEASCQGGKLEYLIVTPPQRAADMTVMNCAKTAQTVYSR